LQDVLVNAFKNKCSVDFKFALEFLNADVNAPLLQFDGLTTFEQALKTPEISDFIELRVVYGAKLYSVRQCQCHLWKSYDYFPNFFVLQKNENSLYPLHYGVESLNIENLKTFLKYFQVFAKTQIEFYSIINFQIAENRNYLHFLIEKLTAKNHESVFEMIKMLEERGCNIKKLNNFQDSPLTCLETKICELNLDTSLLEAFNFRIEFKNREVCNSLSLRYIMHQIQCENETNFEDKLKNYVKGNDDAKNDLVLILERAVLAKSPSMVKSILKIEFNLNFEPKQSIFKMNPIFLACKLEFVDVLKILLTNENLNLTNSDGQTVLLEICSSIEISETLKECFGSIVKDKRCDQNVINYVDSKGLSALNSKIKNVKHNEIHINFKFLKPPNSLKFSYSESWSLKQIGKQENLKNLLLHPVLSCFSLVKWYRLNWLVYI
jgi:hypothetical protein